MLIKLTQSNGLTIYVAKEHIILFHENDPESVVRKMATKIVTTGGTIHVREKQSEVRNLIMTGVK